MPDQRRFSYDTLRQGRYWRVGSTVAIHFAELLDISNLTGEVSFLVASESSSADNIVGLKVSALNLQYGHYRLRELYSIPRPGNPTRSTGVRYVRARGLTSQFFGTTSPTMSIPVSTTRFLAVPVRHPCGVAKVTPSRCQTRVDSITVAFSWRDVLSMSSNPWHAITPTVGDH